MTKAEKPQVADIPPQDEFEEKNKAAVSLAIPAGNLPVDDLPESVRNQLVGYAEIELETQLIDCVESIGTLATVDKIVVALWRRHKREDIKRNKIMSTLNALAQEGRISKQSTPRGYRAAAPVQEPVNGQ